MLSGSSFWKKVKFAFHLKRFWRKSGENRITEFMLLQVQCVVSIFWSDCVCYIICWWFTETHKQCSHFRAFGTSQRYQKPVLWPYGHDQNPKENLSNKTDHLNATIKATCASTFSAEPQPDYLHAALHWCSNSNKIRPNQILNAHN